MFVQAVELGLRHAEAEAQRQLARLVAQARERVEAEKAASRRRLARWLSQSRVPAGKAEKILAEDGRVYDEAAAALQGARLVLDQAALVQLL
jgi:hypothetical protein